MKRLLACMAVLASLAACSDEPERQPGKEEPPVPVDLRIAGMGAAAEVSFDEQGVLHAVCETDEDCAAVLGYFHARDRFFQMDFYRRVARGRLSTLLAVDVVETDVFVRTFLSTREGEPIEEAVWEIMDAGTKAIVEAYAAGVNAWLADLREGRNGAKLSVEYELDLVHGEPAGIPDWEPLDTVAFARLLTMQLSDSSAAEIELGAAFANLAAEDVRRAVALFTPAQATTTFTMPAAGVEYGAEEASARQAMVAEPSADLAPLRGLQARLAGARELLEQARRGLEARSLLGDPWDPAGSNNWVLARERTAAGKPLLANDPHLSLENPAIWYFADLDSRSSGRGTLHVAGATFPGIPGVPVGRNEDVAWGVTVANYDVSDVYVETLTADRAHVLFDPDGDGVPEEVAIVEKEVRFGGAGAEVTRTLRYVPHHGPILQVALGGETALAVRWTGHEPTDELTAFLDLARARTIGEAKEALKRFRVGAQNFVLMDTGLDVGWYPHADVPLRSWASYSLDAGQEGSLPPWLPLPGDGSAEWEGYVPSDELPQLFDPPNGFVATASQDMTGATADGDPTNESHPVFQTMVAAGFRETRIVEMIEAIGDEHSVETSLAMQADTRSLPAATILPAMLVGLEGYPFSEDAQRLADALSDWEYTCPTGLATSDPAGAYSEDPVAARESIGCTAFHFLLNHLYEHAYGDELEVAGFGRDHQVLIRPLVLAFRADRPVAIDVELLWDDLDTEEHETRELIIPAAFESAGAAIARELGPNPDDWRWGRVHTVTFRSRVSEIGKVFQREDEVDLGPFANDGGVFTVDVANSSAATLEKGGFEHGAGASLRMVHEATGEGITSWLQLPGGQELHRGGAHYGDLLDGWLANEPFQLPFYREELEPLGLPKLVVGP